MGREAEGRVSVEQVGDAEAKDVMGLAAAGLGWLAGWLAGVGCLWLKHLIIIICVCTLLVLITIIMTAS